MTQKTIYTCDNCGAEIDENLTHIVISQTQCQNLGADLCSKCVALFQAALPNIARPLSNAAFVPAPGPLPNYINVAQPAVAPAITK